MRFESLRIISPAPPSSETFIEVQSKRPPKEIQEANWSVRDELAKLKKNITWIGTKKTAKNRVS